MVKIRKAQPSDWPIIQKLNHEVYEASREYDPYLDMERPYSSGGEKSYQDDIANSFCIIAEIQGQPIGYLVGKETSVDYRKVRLGEIDHMGVSPQYRSQNIGTQLVNEFKHWCKGQGIKRIHVSAYAKNEKSVNFYKKQGLVPQDLGLEGDI